VDGWWEYVHTSQTHECRNWTEAPLFPEKEYIKGIFFAVFTISLGMFGFSNIPRDI
jgi:hypothetical protein